MILSEYDYETSLTFSKTKYFWKMLNRNLIIEDKDSLNNTGGFKLILFSSLPEDFNTCIDEYGDLKTTATGMTKIDSTWYDETLFELDVAPIGDGSDGFVLFVDNDGDVNITINEDDGFYIKGVALVVTGSETSGEYVVAYSRLLTPAMCKNAITIADGSEFIRQGVCEV